MRHPRLAAAAVAACTLITVLPTTASAQGWLDRVKKKAKETIQQRTDQATDSVTNAAFDKAEHVVKCVVGDKQCIKNAQAAGQAVAVVNAQGQPVSSADSARAIAQATGATGSLATGAAAPATMNATAADPHNDFTPGTDVLFQTDFAGQTVGDFPRNVQLKSGNAEIVNFNGGTYLRATDGTHVLIPLPTVLPQRFTLEFDMLASTGWNVTVETNPDPQGGQAHGVLKFSNSGDAYIDPDKGAASGSSIGQELKNQLIHAAVMADSNYVKIYINGQRLGNSPNAPLGRSKNIEIYLPASRDEPALLGNIRVAAGGRDMYQALSTEGHFTTHGINFATGSAAIDPSSASTLSQIGQMLQQHPDLKLEIDGHTDNVGSAASNMTLSDQRAAAVKQYLVSNFQVDPSRLASKGFGATKPIAPNTTEDGRAQNRRVDLVKL